MDDKEPGRQTHTQQVKDSKGSPSEKKDNQKSDTSSEVAKEASRSDDTID